MFFLLITSLIWAFSFGLIKNQLAPLDPIFVAAARLFFSLLIFLPFIRIKIAPRVTVLRLILIGAVQYGVMYFAYISAFQFLKAYEVALFTIFTPIYVTIIGNFLQKKLNLLFLFTSLLTILGTALVERAGFQRADIWIGFILMQISNISFAVGQVYYRKIMANQKIIKDHQAFGWLYLGGFLTAAVSGLFLINWQKVLPTIPQWISLLYLGFIASGIGFFLWNYGARRVNLGTLTIFNDLKIPLSILVSIIVFSEKADLPGLITGGCIILLAFFINELGVRKQLNHQEVF